MCRLDTATEKEKLMRFSISKVFHSDHGVSPEMMMWAINEVKPAGGVFIKTLELPTGQSALTCKLHGPACGDEPVRDSEIKVRDAADAYRPETPFVKRAPRLTRLLTIIGNADGEAVTIYTAYGGPQAARVPNDPSLKPGTPEHDAAVRFWADHALSE